MVDEQRQSVASWKRKAQKAQGEANDIREGNARTLSPNTLSLSKRHKSNLAGNGDSVSKPPRALRLLLEEQTSRNTLLEKKQRKFDAEVGSLNEELRRESDAREKVARELDYVLTEARKSGNDAHFGALFGTCAGKNAERPAGHPNRKLKGRAVFLETV